MCVCTPIKQKHYKDILKILWLFKTRTKFFFLPLCLSERLPQSYLEHYQGKQVTLNCICVSVSGRCWKKHDLWSQNMILLLGKTAGILRTGVAGRRALPACHRQTNDTEIVAQPSPHSLKRRAEVALRLSTVVHLMRKIPAVASFQLCNYTHGRWFGFCFTFHLRDERRETWR